MAKLLYLADNIVVREYPLTEGALRIGRSSENDIQIDDGAVSGEHAIITMVPSTYFENQHDAYLEDKGSTNGTFLFGRRIERQLLKHGDEIHIGNYQFKYINEENVSAEETRLLLEDEELG